MPAPGETERVKADFSKYVDAQVRRLTTLRTVLETDLPIVSDLARCNEALIVAGRPDLIMTERAPMISYNSPGEVIKRANNFVPNFQMFSEMRETRDEHGFFTTERTPVTEELLKRIKDGSLPYSTFVEGGENWVRDHSATPAFQRMLTLFPDFTIPFVLNASRSKMDYGYFAPELFVAYQLMSRLVNTDDESVMQHGKVDDWYLCR